jgi:hypothetical protein
MLRSPQLAGNAMSIHGHEVSPLPDLELFEIRHAALWQRTLLTN